MNRFLRLLELLWVPLALCLAMWVHPSAQAQPTVGALFQDVLPLGGGSSVPLPPGQWKATQMAEVPDGSYKWKAYVLINQDPRASVAAVVVRDMDARVRWGGTPCDNPSAPSNANAFLINSHGTQSSQLINKCSRIFNLDNFAAWRDSPARQSESWWKDLVVGLSNIDAKDTRQFLVAELRVQEFNGRGLRYELFFEAPQGKTSVQFRDEYRAGTVNTEHRLLEGWISVLMESMQQSYLAKKPQPALMALGYKIPGGGVSAVTTAKATPAAPVAPAAVTSAQTTQVMSSSVAEKSITSPKVGAVFQGLLPLGGDSSVPLPPGRWITTQTAEVPDGDNKWKAFVLTNLDPEASVASVVVRYMDARVRWGDTPCHNAATPSNANAVMLNKHGTQSGQLINKCSRIFEIGQMATWRESPFVRSDGYWKDLRSGFDAFAANDDRSFMLAQAVIQELNGRGLRYELFIQAPQGKSARQFLGDYRVGAKAAEHRLLEVWVSAMMESLQQSFFAKKPQPGLTALGYKTQGGGGATAATTPVIPANATNLQQPQVPSTAYAMKSASPMLVGAIFQSSLPLASGGSVPLPPGSWKTTQMAEVPSGTINWKSYVLINQDRQSPAVAIVVREVDAKVRWGDPVCLNPGAIDNADAFMVNAHGTQSSQPVKKCSRVSPVGNLALWRDLGNGRNQNWWKDFRAGFSEFEPSDDRRFLLADARIYKSDGPGLRYEVFLEAPPQNFPERFRDSYRSGNVTAEHRVLEDWISSLMTSMQQSYLEKKPQAALAALDFKTRSATLAQAAPVPAITAASAATPPVTTSKPVTAVTVSAAAPAAAPVNATPSASPAVPSSTLAAPQLSAAPKPPATPAPAQDAEARELRQQLEKMQQMIAQLQAANAASAKAAQAAAEVSAAAVAKKPAAQPIMANRKALVIGNDLYTDVPKLSNAGADADAMAKSLEQVGFQVSKHLNVNEKSFKQALRDFRLKVQGGDEVLFFFAGHGVQLGAANYLLPTDIKGDHEEQVKDEAIQLQKVLDDLQDKKTKFALAVVDACRDNPFKGQGRAIGGRGLAPTTAATGQMIIFSAGSGQQALDKLGPSDKDRNGLFTRIFVKEMVKPGVSVDRVLRNVRNEVVRQAQGVGHEQTPALYDQAVGEFFFLQ